MENSLPPIPVKRYFSISEVGDLCGVKPHVLRYWEQEFTQLRPMKRRGNRRYYQHHEVLMIRHIRALLYDQGFTIQGARHKMQGGTEFVQPEGRDDPVGHTVRHTDAHSDGHLGSVCLSDIADGALVGTVTTRSANKVALPPHRGISGWQDVRRELIALRDLLTLDHAPALS